MGVRLVLAAMALLLGGRGARADAAALWSAGSGATTVQAFADGTYTVSTAGAADPRLSGGVNQTVALPAVALTGARTTSGTQGRLGAFTAVEFAVSSAGAAVGAAAGAPAKCGALEQDRDYGGNDIRFVDNVTEPAKCCALCLAEPKCAGYSLMGAADTGKPWAQRCYLKSAMLHAHPFKTHISAKIPGRAPAPAPAPPGPPAPPPARPLPPHTVISLVFTIKYFQGLDLFLFEQQCTPTKQTASASAFVFSAALSCRARWPGSRVHQPTGPGRGIPALRPPLHLRPLRHHMER